VTRTPTRAHMAEAPGGLWQAPRSRELLRPERHFCNSLEWTRPRVLM
jgi:hypothetical protein